MGGEVYALMAEIGIVLAIVGLLVAVGEGLVEYLIAPLFDKFGVDKFWLPYVAAVVIGGLVFASGSNLFEAAIPYPLVGRILTAIAAGRGGNWLHDLFSAKAKQAAAAKAARLAEDAMQAYYAAQTKAALIARGHNSAGA